MELAWSHQHGTEQQQPSEQVSDRGMRAFAGGLHLGELGKGNRRPLFRASQKRTHVSPVPILATNRGASGTSVQVTERNKTTAAAEVSGAAELSASETVAGESAAVLVQTAASTAVGTDTIAAAPALKTEASSNKESKGDVVDSTKLVRRAVSQAQNPRNIVFVTSEVAPWSKTGGLGDVCGSLPQALVARGHRVLVIAPRYAKYEDAVDTKKKIGVDVLGTEVGLFHATKEGVDYVFLDHPCYPRPGGLYSDEFGDYGDNQLELGERGKYGQDVIFIANDWHSSLVPVYLAAKYRPHGVYTGARTVLCIHNLRYQGVFPPYTYNSLGLPGDWYGAVEYQYPPHLRQGSYAEEGRSVNHLKAGIVTADRILTVSPGYAGEIKTTLGGWGMDGILRSREYVLNGIVNGIDDMDWNPAIDRYIPFHYTAEDFIEGKKKNKRALQEELGLPTNDVPLIAFIGRLDNQKGADLIMEAVPWIMEQNVQLVCLGSGSKDLENALKWLENTYRDRARGWVGFNVAFSHKLTAAADILLMPSRFEPCGLNQLYAMRYGTVPVAHRTGGLRDTVIPFDPWKNEGTGWVFDNCDVQGLQFGIGCALQTLRSYQSDFRKVQLRGMTQDLSWDKAAQQYEQVFDWAAFDKPFCS